MVSVSQGQSTLKSKIEASERQGEKQDETEQRNPDHPGMLLSRSEITDLHIIEGGIDATLPRIRVRKPHFAVYNPS